MPIIIIEGATSSGKTTIANALRNQAISFGRGALLVDEQTEGEVKPLLEKILAGVDLKEGVAAEEQAWKLDCSIVLVGERASMLLAFEEAAPGFTELHGPVYRVTTAHG